MREIGLLDCVLRLPMTEVYLEMLARGYGSDLDHLTRVQTAFVGSGSPPATVSVIELTAGAKVMPAQSGWSPLQAGGHDGFRYGYGSTESGLVWPAADLAVGGSIQLLRDVLEGRQPTGGAHPELAPLLAGDGVLVQFAYGRFGLPYDEVLRTFGPWFGDRDDPVDFVRLRVHEERDGGLVLSVTFRFQSGTTGLRGTEDLVREQLQTMREQPRFAAFRRLFADVVVAHTQRDLTASLRLGPPRQAVATVERAVMALMALVQKDARR